MTIETKFDKGQKVFLIDNDEIISLPVNGVEYKNGTITYSFIKHKSQTLMDKDTVVYRDEERCFGSIENMVERFKLKS